MNSFRIKDLRFRILKGGKIGLAMAIGFLGSINLQAQSFFDGYTQTSNNYTLPGATYQITSGPRTGQSVTFANLNVPYYTRVGAAQTATFTQDMSTNQQDIVYSPTYTGSSTTGVSLEYIGWNDGSYGYIVGGTFSAGIQNPIYVTPQVTSAPNSSRTAYATFSSTIEPVSSFDNYTVTMDQNTTATAISKAASATYTANLELSGNNTVSGSTNIGNGNIKLNGSGNFSDVTAGSINVNTTSTSTFNDSINLTDKITYSQAGTVIANNGLTGNIDFGTSGGSFTLNGGSITGNITGTGTFKFDSIGTSTIDSPTTITNLNIATNTGTLNTKDLTSDNITYTNNGILHVDGTLTSTNGVDFGTTDGTLKLSNGDIGFSITNSDGKATVVMAGGTQAINNQIGTSTTKIKELGIGTSTTASTTTINADIYASNTKIFGNSEIKLSEGKNINSSINSNMNGQGNLTLLGGIQTLTNDIGTSGIKLNTINAAASGATSNFNGNTYANSISLGAGIGTFNGTTVADVVFSDAGTANFNSGLTGGINFAGKDAIVNIVGNANISGGVTTTTNNTGTVTFDSPVTVGFNLGTSVNGLKLVSFADDTSIHSNIYSDELKMNANKTITLNDGFNFYDTNKSNQGITTNTDNQGKLTVEGTSTIDSAVGTSTAKFNEINAGITGKTATFNELIYANKLQFSGDGKIVLGGINTNDTTNSLIVNIIDFGNGGAGTLELKNNVNITTGSNSTTFANSSNANLEFQANSTVTGSLGENSTIFNKIIGGGNSSTLDVTRDITTANLVYNGSGTVKLGGTLSNGSSNTVVDFGTHDGKLEISGDLNATLSNENAKATVVMAGGIQAINGSIGSNTNKIKKLEIGNSSTTTSFVDIFAVDTNLGSTSSTFRLDTNKNITSNIAGNGILIFVGGEQTATGNIGTTSELSIINSSIASEDITNLVNSVNALNTNIGAGTTNFNTDTSSLTTTTLNFTADNGVANLHTGLVGNVDFANKDALVNNWDGKTLEGDILSTGGINATVNMKGAGSIVGNIGTNVTDGIKNLNLNTEGTSSKTVEIDGNVYAKNINFKNDAVLNLVAGNYMTGTDSTPLLGNQAFIFTDVNDTGKLNLSGSNTITGVIGSSDKILNSIEAGTNGSTDTLNNMVFVNTLKFNGNGTVVLNGQSGIDVNNAGLKGNVDLNNTTGELQIGEGVNLTTGTSGIEFANTSTAKLKFNGNSTITGILGGDTEGRSTFESVYAGENSKIVTFKDDVYVKESSTTPATLHVSGTGIVNLEGDLYGDINYDNDGIINVANAKSIIISQAPIAVKTSSDATGTLNFLGSTTLANSDIAEVGSKLKSVNFNTIFNNIHQMIDQNIYAVDTNIGNIDGNTTLSLFDATGSYDYAGASVMKEFRGGTSVNFVGNKTIGGNLNLANATTAINIGTSHLTILDTLNTNNGAISFTVNTKDITGVDDASSTSDDSGYVSTNSLIMSGNEKIHINYVGSLANNGTYTLINGNDTVGSYLYDENENSLISDNSFSIDSSVKLDTNTNDLIVSADRTAGGAYEAKDLYVEKSDTKGHFSNNAAKVLAKISGDGKQSGDMIEVIQKLEIDSFGYGETKEKLATQVKKLAPIVNNSIAQTAINSSSVMSDTISNRISDVRGLSSGDATLDNSTWAKVITSTGTQSSVGIYDGYEITANGLSFGYDRSISSDLILGVSLGLVQSDTTQLNFRNGDVSDTTSYQASLYASKLFDKAYLDGIVSYGINSTSGKRATAIDRTANYSVDATQYGLKLETGYNFKVNNINVTPYTSLDYNMVTQDGYKETGAGALNLNVDAVDMARGSVGLGVKTSTDVTVLDTTITPSLKVGYNQYFGDTEVETVAKFEQGDSFITPSAEMMKSMYHVGTGIKTDATDNLTLSLDGNYKSSDNGYESTDLQASIKYKF